MNDEIKNKRSHRVSGKSLQVAAGSAGLLLIMAWAGGAFRSKSDAGESPYQPGLPVPAGAATFTVENTLMVPRVALTGTVAPVAMNHVSSRLSAYVKQVYVSAGSAVTNGQVLVELDDREVLEQLAGAEAGLSQAEKEFRRTEKLFANGATTEQAFTAAESAYHAARAQVEQIKVMQSYTRMASPLDGVVVDRNIEEGDLAGPGQVLLSLYNPNHMRLEVPVPVRFMRKLGPGTPVNVDLGHEHRPMAGRISEVVSAVDPSSRTRLVKIRLDAGGEAVLPGTYARLWVEDQERPTILIPESATFRSGQLVMVQAVRNNRVIRTLVTLGSRQGDRVEVLSGLAPGDVLLKIPVQET